MRYVERYEVRSGPIQSELSAQALYRFPWWSCAVSTIHRRTPRRACQSQVIIEVYRHPRRPSIAAKSSRVSRALDRKDYVVGAQSMQLVGTSIDSQKVKCGVAALPEILQELYAFRSVEPTVEDIKTKYITRDT